MTTEFRDVESKKGCVARLVQCVQLSMPAFRNADDLIFVLRLTKENFISNFVLKKNPSLLASNITSSCYRQ